MLAFVSQREGLDKYGQAIDSIEVAYLNLLQQLGFEHVLVSNSQQRIRQLLDKLQPDLILLTGGGDLSRNLNSPRDRTEGQLLKLALERDTAVLGICRGFQFINAFFGGVCSRLENVDARGILKPRQVYKAQTTADFPGKFDKFSITSYHDKGILSSNLGKGLVAMSVCCEIPEFVTSAKLTYGKVMGVIWHPERSGAPTLVDKQIFDYLIA